MSRTCACPRVGGRNSYAVSQSIQSATLPVVRKARPVEQLNLAEVVKSARYRATGWSLEEADAVGCPYARHMNDWVPWALALLPVATFVAGVVVEPVRAGVARYFARKDEAARRAVVAAEENAERQRQQDVARSERQRSSGSRVAQEVFNILDDFLAMVNGHPVTHRLSSPSLERLIAGLLERIPSAQVRSDLRNGLDIFYGSQAAIDLHWSDESVEALHVDVLQKMRTVVAGYLNEEQPDEVLSNDLMKGAKFSNEALTEYEKQFDR